MTSYVITDMKVSDPQRYENYRALSPAAIQAAGGQFVVRGGQCETLEGNWKPARMVVVSFPTYEKAKAFYDSELYRQAREARAGTTEYFNMVVVQGADE